LRKYSSGASSQDAPPPAPDSVSSIVPMQTYLGFKGGKFDPLLKKPMEFNTEVLEHLRLQGKDVEYLEPAVDKLKSGAVRTELRPVEKDVTHEICILAFR